MPPELARTQKWLQGAIIAGEAVPARQARARILPSRTLKPEQRLDIYRGMYEVRLYGALAADYPGVLDFLGEERFGELVHLYLQAHPSKSYTLNRLGDHLPDFIEDELSGVPRRGLLHDLSRYELTQTTVFDEKETPSLSPGEIGRIPEAAWPGARLRTIAAFRLIELRYPAHRYLKAMRAERKRPKLMRKPAWLAVVRVNYAMSTLELTEQSYRLLSSIAAGKPLGEALRGVKATKRSVGNWFRAWTAAGVFAEVITP